MVTQRTRPAFNLCENYDELDQPHQTVAVTGFIEPLGCLPERANLGIGFGNGTYW